jgi:large subunit ribosomal protein L22
MEVKASLKHLRMSARKIRLVIDVIRKMPVDAAIDQLKFNNKLASTPVIKLIKSAIANAENTYSLERSNLFIKEIKADEGVTLKRWMPKAHGRATVIRKRGCHVDVVLGEIKESAKKEKKVVKTDEPVKLEKLVKDSETTAAKATAAKSAGKKVVAPEKAKMFRRKAGK